MTNPALNDKRFEGEVDEWKAGYAAPGTADRDPGPRRPGPAHHPRRGHDRERHLRQDLRAVPLRPGGWCVRLAADQRLARRPDRDPGLGLADRASSASGWRWSASSSPRHRRSSRRSTRSPRACSSARSRRRSSSQWDGIVFQAVLATVGVFFATLALYVFGVVKVTKKFQVVVIGATLGIFVMYLFGLVLSLFGVDMVFWNDPTPFGIIFSVVICVVAVAEPVPRLRVHPPGVARRRAEVHGVVRGLRDHGHPRVAVPRDPATAVPAAPLRSTRRENGSRNAGAALPE